MNLIGCYVEIQEGDYFELDNECRGEIIGIETDLDHEATYFDGERNWNALIIKTKSGKITHVAQCDVTYYSPDNKEFVFENGKAVFLN